MDESGAGSLFGDDEESNYSIRKTNRERAKSESQHRPKEKNLDRERRKRFRKPDGSKTFRCRHCRTMVGPTLSGGKHRNHCPLCLHSLHVDGKMPGDRSCDCRSLMAPVGLYARPSGEQVIVHECLGCGFKRFNRVAADDNPLAVMRLALVNPPFVEDRQIENEHLASL